MKYKADIKEIWIRTMEIEANSLGEARQKALDGIGKELDFEYSETLWQPCIRDAKTGEIILDYESR